MTSGDEVVIADFGGCKIIGHRQEGETDRDVHRRFAKAKMEREEERRRKAAERKRFARLLSRWEPPKGEVL